MSVRENIFNQKFLKDKLKNFIINEIPDYEIKWKQIKKWNYSLEKSNLAKTKEESIQGDFLNTIFTNVLDYKNRVGRKLWNIQQEQRTVVDGTKADGSLGFFSDTVNDVRVVIELKDATTDLDKKQKRQNNQTPVEQAFSYQYKMRSCKWIIVSNFREIRLYQSSTMTEYESFLMSELAEDEEIFKKFYFLLHKENLIELDGPSVIDNLYANNEKEQERISERFYEEYKSVREELYKHLRDNNPDVEELTIFEKTQKILDRFIFVCFCEDSKLLPDKIFRKVLEAANSSFNFSETKTWDQLKGLFHSIDKGNPPLNINKFNGGLFKADEVLDHLIIKDEIFPLFEKITEYDFDSELDVNILGHIFEQSISDIEEFKAQILDEEFDKKKGKRKKDGVFYTPTYVTQYIVKETIGRWFRDKRIKLGEDELPDIESAKTKSVRTRFVNQHIDFWENYRDAVANIRILDPACGSGAFLNTAFNYLLEEATMVNNTIAELRGGQTTLFDLDKHILKYNLFGADINPESIEITKLSLWIKTANRNDELTSLDENIKCGNSLVEEKSIDPNKAFKWDEQFPEVMVEGGFDVIIGNPPYGALVDAATKEYLKNRFEAYNHNFDVYTAFIELSFSLLKDKSYLGFIIPVSWQTGPNYTSTREYLSKHTTLKQAIKLPYDIFEAYVDTGIYIIQKGAEKQYTTNVFEFPIRYNREKAFENQLEFEELNNRTWIEAQDMKFVLNPSFYTFNNKVRENTESLETFVDSIRGILANKEDIYEEIKTDQDRLFFTGDLYRYEIRKDFKYVKYGENLKEYPRDDRYFKGPRILVRRLISRQFRVMCSYTEEEFVNKKDIYNLVLTSDQVNIYYILGILNSKMVSYLLTKGSTTATKDDFSQLTLTDLRQLPIKVIDTEQQELLGNKVKELLDTRATFVEARENTLDFIQQSLGIKKVSKNLFEFYTLEFADFENELKKQKINLTLLQKEEWFGWFREKKGLMARYIGQMIRLERAIDREVYTIYGLNEEEIKLIEQSI